MTQPLAPDLCIIGAGSGGLSVAAGAAQMGAEVVLIERGLMGGDCLNFGCVPSKSLLAAARLAEIARTEHGKSPDPGQQIDRDEDGVKLNHFGSNIAGSVVEDAEPRQGSSLRQMQSA